MPQLQHSPIAASDILYVQNITQKLKKFECKSSPNSTDMAASPPTATALASSSSAAASSITPACQPAKRMREQSAASVSPEPVTSVVVEKDVNSMSPEEIMKDVLITVRELRSDIAELKVNNNVFSEKIKDIEKSVQFNCDEVSEIKKTNEQIVL